MTKNNKNLGSLRESIDSVDEKLLELLNERATFVLDVGKVKEETGQKTFYVPERENAIYERLTKSNDGPFPNKAVRNVWREIISASLAMEKPLKIAYLGPPATFTHQACMNHFGLSGELVPKNEIADIFSDVEAGRAELGVVPIENTTEGVVSHTLDRFIDSDLKIISEIMLEVSQTLMNKDGDIKSIKKICSYSHATAQCTDWLKKNLKNIPTVDVDSTARAAEMASEDSTLAAIASEAAASLYGLQIVERSINDEVNNYTRFLVIGKKATSKTGNDKTSLMFAIKDAPGALYDILMPFASRNINMTRIESRPIKKKAWEYVFFIDLDGHIDNKENKEAIAELEKLCSFVKVLGSYPRSVGKK